MKTPKEAPMVIVIAIFLTFRETYRSKWLRLKKEKLRAVKGVYRYTHPHKLEIGDTLTFDFGKQPGRSILTIRGSIPVEENGRAMHKAYLETRVHDEKAKDFEEARNAYQERIISRVQGYNFECVQGPHESDPPSYLFV